MMPVYVIAAVTTAGIPMSLGLIAGVKPGFLSQQLGHTLKMFFYTYAKYIKSENNELELTKIDVYMPTRHPSDQYK